ncbi:hypothetical protein DNC_02220 [Chlamydia muridarum]|uniref:Uncharacterized protein n=2 Tax=Chlamydia muridarum TaxID=83560 RepID=A0A069ZZ76_CHLMR|nr:hypothetical protein TC_0445 [Chlamydia muridarum str. Nigg]AHH23319.1 hypothetical protein TAC_02325 [Chlamydia muridarum str. Nigg3 CMUT3-5]AHH24245.1 hypothetical protein Y015_02325 [Chlamydia muridarum str. Nigg CM972]AID38439.1 hypothetical protein BB17_02365 [Chlamydia muridarum str. Nigg 2 MCR]AIT90632.1 hypothetical protein NC80_02200 [Chlamydia muridarum]
MGANKIHAITQQIRLQRDSCFTEKIQNSSLQPLNVIAGLTETLNPNAEVTGLRSFLPIISAASARVPLNEMNIFSPKIE